ncbi:N-6 DNA methylase [Shewanella chilikensis]|uniref:site-specific DNA-methyltransferase (adenine-specific) n=1 Tax=Shewanella chilikensis TaxID=558541 RepID=A0ABX5PR06_9GAMM|nr:type ISP restriction/modification enzyme [Shewanella chilikensis]MCL1153966.1 N-6 DNA methylase [Shewanella chilikensis]PYE59931.1 N-6 DNA methylase [Shewanella chilikensis]GGZ19849.1 hypothetical protein GCM10007105_04650 [Shewanella chilikensis]
MSFDKITESYLKSFQEVCKATYSSGVNSIELASRPVVHRYIESLINLFKSDFSEIVIHHDVNYTKHDRPDWRLEDPSTFGIYCFGDHKSLSIDKEFSLTKSEKKQIERYISLGRPVFVFDGLEFLFFEKDIENPKREQLIPKPANLSSDWDKISANPSVEIEFRNLINNPGYRRWTESQLIEQLAVRARTLSEELKDLLCAPIGSGASTAEEHLIVALHSLKGIIEKHHDPSLSDINSCSDFIAQVLTFGLFYAHTRNPINESSPKERRVAIGEFWNSSATDDAASKLRPFKSIIDELSGVVKGQNILSDWYAEVLGVLAHAEFMGTEKTELDFHALFETFLDKFDSRTRFDRGAFYTPSVLSNWTVEFTKQLCEKHFSGNIFEIADKIIDPCCGTGSFLEALFRENKEESNCKLVGLEILPAPYALAHYRMFEVEKQLSSKLNIEILLTDTLSDYILDSATSIDEGFSKERERAASSCKPPIKIVIGNPPSSNHPANSAPRTKIDSLLNDFRPPKSEISDRQNIQKALNNEAFRFLRWCCERILENGEGIVSLILPGAFTRAISFKYARKWIAEQFDHIYVFEIDGDARTNDAIQSIFSVLQGRMVLFCVKTSESANFNLIHYKDITEKSKGDKLRFLQSTLDIDTLDVFNVSEESYAFAPSKKYPKEKWAKYWPLTKTSCSEGIFKVKCSAVKLAPSAMLFHTSEPMLLRRTQELGNAKISNSVLIKKWFSGQKRPPSSAKLTVDVKSKLLKAAQNKVVSSYNFRPFVYGKVLNDDDLFSALSAAPGGGTRARPEVRKAFMEGAVGISFSPSTIDLGSTLTRFSSFSWALPDNDIVARGNAMIYCDQFSFRTKSGDLEVSSNLNPRVESLFYFSENVQRSALYYIYAVSSSSSYLDSFEGVLYGPSNPVSPPRIPIASDLQIRKMLTMLGEELALLENPDYCPEHSRTLSPVQPIPANFRLNRHSYDASTNSLLLIGEQGTITIDNVPEFIFGLKISGHNVVDKWLREKNTNYFRKDFGNIELEELISLLNRVELQFGVLSKIDPIVEKMILDDNVITSSPL